MRKSISDLLRDVVMLEVALARETEAHVLALLLPTYWSTFIRSGALEEVRARSWSSPALACRTLRQSRAQLDSCRIRATQVRPLGLGAAPSP